MSDVWPVVHAERTELLEFLESLDEDQWDSPSLCEWWSVHGEDIRRPLGSSGDYPPAAVERALRYQAKTPVSFGGGKQYLADLTLVADDADVSIGTGPTVSGPLVSLLLVASGRRAVLADLNGPGRDELGDRLGS